ncbi:PDZ domain-containing protein [Pandoraea sputorum]|uniref:hypothetical protein n=1 Tax=Pandoraea sputorum TaxID=93222 RepID=UPI001242F49B|nr:hypothetical protein [Pandoraea sputorum]
MLSGLACDGPPFGRLRVIEGNETLLRMTVFARLDRCMFLPSTLAFCYEASHLAQDEPPPLRPIGIRFVDGHVEVFHNPGQEIERYGLCKGDVLIDVNGKRVEPVAIGAARAPLSTAPVGSPRLTVERAGAPCHRAVSAASACRTRGRTYAIDATLQNCHFKAFNA